MVTGYQQTQLRHHRMLSWSYSNASLELQLPTRHVTLEVSDLLYMLEQKVNKERSDLVLSSSQSFTHSDTSKSNMPRLEYQTRQLIALLIKDFDKPLISWTCISLERDLRIEKRIFPTFPHIISLQTLLPRHYHATGSCVSATTSSSLHSKKTYKTLLDTNTITNITQENVMKSQLHEPQNKLMHSSDSSIYCCFIRS